MYQYCAITRRSKNIGSFLNLGTVNMSTINRRIINSSGSYQPVGPLSQAVLADRTLYISGCLGIDPRTGDMAKGLEGETRQALVNIGHILKEAGASYESVVKTTVMLSDIGNFNVVNKVYGEFFTKSPPARSAYAVGKLPRGASVEIETVALIGDVNTIPSSNL